MKRANVICTDSAAKTLIDWAYGLKGRRGPLPTLDEAATLALEEFTVERRDLQDRVARATAALAEGAR